MSQKDEFTGKYEKSGRIGGLLIHGFFESARRLLLPELDGAFRVLEVGCGAGYSTQRISAWNPSLELYAGDPSSELLARARRLNPGVSFREESVYSLAYDDKSFDAVIMLEVLEHLDDPPAALSELRRICRGRVLLSTPREPLWRILNCARGKYLGNLGNTPGHIQHWSTRSLIKEVAPYFWVEAQATPVPWTILLLRPK